MEFKRKDGEHEYHFIWRVYSYMKQTGKLTQKEAGEICNKELRLDFDESRHRKIYESFEKVWNEVRDEYVTEDGIAEQLDEIELEKDELFKQQVKTRDKIREYRQLLTDDARIENLMDVIISTALDMPKYNYPDFKRKSTGTKSGILRLSDWHIGKKFKNILNEFNKDIAKRRVDALMLEVMKYCELLGISKLYIASLGDLIEGSLRVTARVTSEEDIVQQIMSASELLSYFVNGLCEFGLEITYVSVLDNHSRANANFKEHIEKENFTHLINWHLQTRLAGKIKFVENEIDENIGYLNIDGKTHLFVHGHLKAHAVNSIVQNLTAVVGFRPDYVHVGHWHSSQTKEFSFSKIYINGSLCGVDDYAFSMGFYSKASQSLIVIDGDNELRIDINL